MLQTILLVGIALLTSPNDVYVTTRSGKVIEGRTYLDALTITTDFGSSTVRLAKIEQVHFGFPDVILTTDGTELRGRVSMNTLRLDTEQGSVTLWRSDLELLAVVEDGVPRGMTTIAGEWSTSLGPMKLDQLGLEVTGRYGWENESAIAGRVQGRRLVFGYSEGASRGQGWFDISPDGSTFLGVLRDDGSEEALGGGGYRIEPSRAEPVPGEITTGQTASSLNYYLRVPRAFEPDRPMPALALFPGVGSSARFPLEVIAARWPEIAEAHVLVGFEGEMIDPSSTFGNLLFVTTYVNFSGERVGPAWAYRQTPALVAESMTELSEQLSIDRWFVAGQAEGGYLVYAMAMFYPELIAGALAASADMLVQCHPEYFEDESIRAAQRAVPFAIVHAQNDSAVDYERSLRCYERLIDGGFPSVALFSDARAGHAFAKLPVGDAVEWLDSIAASDPADLMTFAENRYVAGNYRDAWSARARAVVLDEGGDLRPRATALMEEIEAKARPVAEDLALRISRNEDGAWAREFWRFRDRFGHTRAAASVIAEYSELRRQHEQEAEVLYASLLEEPDEKVRRASLQRIVDELYASRYYPAAQRMLGSSSRRRP